MNNIARTSAVVLMATLAWGSAALAQTTPPPTQALPDAAKGCTPQEKSTGNLSQKLDQSNGVLCPPEVDPAMTAPTPNAGKTPVIPPPGSPGGDPTVQPK